ncbi:MAG TPA: hypothetical protein VFA74_14285 [Terriglobales bacterium]|nr:hypothetical protein [Terriglobales bacterium]
MFRLFAAIFAISIYSTVGMLHAQNASSSSRATSHQKASTLDPGTFDANVYRNPALGFTYKVPYGWVDRTQDMQQDATQDNEAGKSQVLLSVFERPPGAPGNTVDSAVVIAAESVSSYPGLKSPADYFGPLTELTTSKGFKVLNQPYEFPVDAKPIIRADYVKKESGLPMQQSSLVMVAKGYVISFTFIGGNEDEVTELIEGLSFGVKKSAH